MAFIHEKPDWPKFTWNSELLATSLAEVRHNQGWLLGRMENLGFKLRREASLEMRTSDVVKSSAIEGEKLDTEEVRSSLARRLGLDLAGLPTPSRHVEGIVEMMLDATTNFSIELTAERLFRWHAALFPTGFSGMSPIAVGQWRPPEAGPMQVVSGPLGRERIHFEAPPADRLAGEMDRFMEWFNSPLQMDSVMKAGVAHFWFVTIHPFEDGNGRIARAIADMALARSDGIKDRFYSMSSQIEAERKNYYWQLENSQRGDLDITMWLEWFQGCLNRAIASAEQGLKTVLRKARLWQQINIHPVNERQRLVINRLLDGFQGFLTTSKYAKLAKCSADTALRDIQEMLERRILVQNPGRGRSTSYRLVDDDCQEN
jgi:Fic family protein